MVTEIAIFTAVPGKEEELGQAILRGLEVIRQQYDRFSRRAALPTVAQPYQRVVRSEPGDVSL